MVQLQDYYRNADENPPSSIEPRNVPDLLPAAKLESNQHISFEQRLSSPIEIQRPSSALHAGDFKEDGKSSLSQYNDSPRASHVEKRSPFSEHCGTSPTTPWFTPISTFGMFIAGKQSPSVKQGTYSFDQRPLRRRAPSLSSCSSSYILRAPTTPLVQESTVTDLDFAPVDLSTSPTKSNRRHTLPPNALYALQTSRIGQLSADSDDGPHPSHHRAMAFTSPKQVASRSLTSTWSLRSSKPPQTPVYSRSRKLSYSETSPLQNASMVGSYEESILRGSMSTAPSKPLDFTAQIGVLGKGNCKPKCPAHVTIPFPAVFYNWGGGVGSSHNIIDDEPSPYVGHIDLQNSLALTERNKSQERRVHALGADAEYESTSVQNFGVNSSNGEISFRKSKKRRRASSPSHRPPGGSYRIPQQGQLQIVIKNPNKTAVKLFLVPYDLAGMEASTKTFIRQRCYCAEPLDDDISTSKPRCTQSTISNQSHLPNRKPTLRYLIHLNICSPCKGRFYLYQHIRVVFANRVPDNKEKLQNEIQIPQPRYSTYKPNRDSLTGPSPGQSPGEIERSSAEKVFRRRSSGFGFPIDSLRGEYSTFPSFNEPTLSFDVDSPTRPISSLNFQLAISQNRDISPPWKRKDSLMPDFKEISRLADGLPDLRKSPPSEIIDEGRNFSKALFSSSYRGNSSRNCESKFERLSPVGGFFGRPATPESGRGLLSRNLRECG